MRSLQRLLEEADVPLRGSAAHTIPGLHINNAAEFVSMESLLATPHEVIIRCCDQRRLLHLGIGYFQAERPASFVLR